MSANSPDDAIALLLAQHAMYQEALPPPPVVTVTMSPTPSPRVKAKNAQPIHRTGLLSAVTPTLTPPGTLDAVGFMRAVRQAGLRPDPSGRLYLDPSHVREDLIQAIQAYVVYDSRQNFGPQVEAAKAKAQATNHPRAHQGLTRSEQRTFLQSEAFQVSSDATLTTLSQREALEARLSHTVGEILDLKKKMAVMVKGSRSHLASGVELNRLQCLLSNVKQSLAIHP